MKKMVALTLALLMAASLFLSGCSVRKDTSDSENSGSSNGSGSGDRVVNVCSWGEYIDESLIDQFEEATVHLTYNIRIVRILKNVTVRNQCDLPFYAVRFGKLPYLENIFFFNHDKNV